VKRKKQLPYIHLSTHPRFRVKIRVRVRVRVRSKIRVRVRVKIRKLSSIEDEKTATLHPSFNTP
jgi:hypothetical protein